MQQQHNLSLQLYEDEEKVLEVISKLNSEKEQLKIKKSGKKNSNPINDEYDKTKKTLKDFRDLSDSLNAIIGNLQAADVTPTSQCIESAKAAHSSYNDMMKGLERK